MPTDLSELSLLVSSRLPIIIVESADEARVITLFKRVQQERTLPLHAWTVTDGLTRLDVEMSSQSFLKQPLEILGHIRSNPKAGIYLLLDFHPYLEDPTIVRLIKEIALNASVVPHLLVFVSYALALPKELTSLGAYFELSLPSDKEIRDIVHEVAREWSAGHDGRKVAADKESLEKLIEHLRGLSTHDVRSLAHQAIFNDGAIQQDDMELVMQAKYRLLGSGAGINYHFERTNLDDLIGLSKLKKWLNLRQEAFVQGIPGLERPKGLLLVGVQGCGKSLAAKAVAGAWGVPLLHLDVGSLFTKYFGESESNLRDALGVAQAMSPCVLWIDELEKALSMSSDDAGTAHRMLASLLTWMAENQSPVFIVATANEIDRLPPELLRKGRLDEIFFVDLPRGEARHDLFVYHLNRREQSTECFDLEALVEASEGFSGAEIEQAIIASLYLARSTQEKLSQVHLLEELQQTRPLSIVMAERIAMLRAWAQERTVMAD